MTLPRSEILGGLAFLESHAPERWKEVLGACREALERVKEEERRDELRAASWVELDVCVRAESVLSGMGLRTIGEVEKLMMKNDAGLRERFGGRIFTKVVLKDLRGALARKGLNH